jgi:tetratricopeptide (TPR) repeat protein
MAGTNPEKTALSLRDHEVLVALLPAFWTPKNVLANGYVTSNQAAKALQPLAQSLAITGRTPEAAPTMYLLGEAFAKLNMSREAVKALEESMALDPRHKDAWKAHRRLSELYLAQGNRAQAVSHRAQYLYLLAVGLKELGARDQAIDSLAQSVALDQQNPYYGAAQKLLTELNSWRTPRPHTATGAAPGQAAPGRDTDN